MRGDDTSNTEIDQPLIGNSDPAPLTDAVAKLRRRRMRDAARRLRKVGQTDAASLLDDALRGLRSRGLAAHLDTDIRGAVAEIELALGLVELSERAAKAKTEAARSARAGDLFAAVAATPHLLRTARRGVPDRDFVERSGLLAQRLLDDALSGLPLAVAFVGVDGLAGRRFALASAKSTERATIAGEHLLGGTPSMLRLAPGPGHTVEITRDAIIVRQGRTNRLRVDRALAPTGPGRTALLPRPRIQDGPFLGRRLISRPASILVGRHDPEIGVRLSAALALLGDAWSEARDEVLHYTSTIVPLHEPGTVSYSMAARPGFSYINVDGKSLLQLTDDLLHETAHHKLHTAEELGPLVEAGIDEPVWWSPWRRAWRPLRGIVHATYTFTYGALLFAHLLALEDRRMTPARRRFAAERLIEEETCLAFSLEDLDIASEESYLTPRGCALASELEREYTARIRPSATSARSALRWAGVPGRRALDRMSDLRRDLGKMRKAEPGLL